MFSFIFVNCGISLLLYKALNGRQIFLNGSVTTSVGKNEMLQCTFIKNSGDLIISVFFFANDWKEEPLVTMIPNKDPEILDFGEYLSVVTLTGITDTSTEANIMLNNISCRHEREFKCRLLVLPTGESNTKHTDSNILNISVQAFPEKPTMISCGQQGCSDIGKIDCSTRWQSATTLPNGKSDAISSVIVEGSNYNITFSCSGNIGKPPGNFIWQKYLQETKTWFNYSDVTTTFSFIPDACSYNGTSNLTLSTSSEDNQAFIRCLVQHSTAGDEIYDESQTINVLYKPRKPMVTKNPDLKTYKDGSEPIILNCTTDGNPHPSYRWYVHDQNADLSLTNEYVINDVITNKSGSYVCEVKNCFCGKEYVESSSTVVMIVKRDGTADTASVQEPSHVVSVVGIICGTIVALAIIVLIGIYFMRRRHEQGNNTRNEIRTVRKNLSREQDIQSPGYEGVFRVSVDHQYEELSSSTNQYDYPDPPSDTIN